MNNPLGSPDGEECLFTMEENPLKETTNLLNQNMNVMVSNDGKLSSMQQRENFNIKSLVSPVFGHSKRFKRPQSAKVAFQSIKRFKKNSSFPLKTSQNDYSSLHLKNIFSKNIEHPSKVKSYVGLAKPPMGRCKNRKKRQEIQTHDQFESFLNVYNSEVDPRTTMSSYNSKPQFNFTNRFSTGPVRAVSNGPKQRFKAYHSNSVRPLKIKNTKLKRPKLKNFIKNADTLREIKKQIMDDNNYTLS